MESETQFHILPMVGGFDKYILTSNDQQEQLLHNILSFGSRAHHEEHSVKINLTK